MSQDEPVELPLTGGSLLIAWQLRDKRVLIIGGGEVAAGRAKSILSTGAYITVIAPAEGLHPHTKIYIESSQRITYYDRKFAGPEDLENVNMVLTAIDDVRWSQRIYELCRERKIPVNVADIPPMCDFYFGSQIRDGPLQIMISTNGNGPKLANIVKRHIEDNLPTGIGSAIEQVGILRTKLRERAPGGELGKRRMKWMSSLCTAWAIDELRQLDDSKIETLLDKGWEKDIVPEPREIGITQTQCAERWNTSVLDFTLPAAASIAIGFAITYLLLRLRR